MDTTLPRDGGIGDEEYNPSNAEQGWCTDDEEEHLAVTVNNVSIRPV